MNRNAKFAAVAGLAAMSLALSGCLGGGNATQGKSDSTIRFAAAETAPASMEALTAAGKEYEKETGIKVTFEAIPLDDIYTKTRAAVGTGAAYDGFITGFVGHIAMFNADGALAPVDDLIDELGGQKNFYDGRLAFPIDGKSYMLPYDYNNAMGYIRGDWLEEAGLQVPTTWDELLNVAKAFSARGDNQYGLIMPLSKSSATNWVTSQVMWASGVQVFDDDWKVVLDDKKNLPLAVKSLELLKELHQYMPASADTASYPELTDAFQSGQVGMTFYTGKAADVLFSSDPAAASELKAFGFPTIDGKGTTATLGYKGFGVFKNAETDETKKFLKWYYESGALLDLYATSPYHFEPAQKSVFESEEWRSLPRLQEGWEDLAVPMEEMLSNPNLRSIDTLGPSVDKRSGDVLQSMVFPEMFQRVVIGGEDPEAVVRAAADQIRSMTR